MVDESVRVEQRFCDWAWDKLKMVVERGRKAENPGANSKARIDIEKMRQARLEQIRSLNPELIFGRIVTNDDEDYRVGLITVYDDNNDVLVIDWRTKEARNFYKDASEASNLLSFRRTISMRGEQVVRCEDDFGMAPSPKAVRFCPAPGTSAGSVPGHATNGSVIRPVGLEILGSTTVTKPRSASKDLDAEFTEPAYMAKASENEPPAKMAIRARGILDSQLAAERTGRLRHHLSTLQPDQYDLVTRDPSRPMIVEGGPGTGKTLVALHRAAYLLEYSRDQHRDARGSKVLVAGPSNDYVAYLSKFMNSVSVAETVASDSEVWIASVEDIALRVLKSMDIEVGSTPRFEEPAKAAIVKTAPGIKKALERYVWSHARVDAVVIQVKTVLLQIRPADIHHFIEELRTAGIPYGKAQTHYSHFLHDRLDHLLREQEITAHRAQRECHEEMDMIIVSDALLDDAFPVIKNVRREYVTLLQQKDELRRFAADDLADVDIDEIEVRFERAHNRTWLSRQDLFLLLYMASIIHGQEYWPKFSHIIVDEAQDVTRLEWETLRGMSSSNSYTIIGDMAQATSGIGLSTWSDISSTLGIVESPPVRLGYSYRTPRLLSDLTEGLRARITGTSTVTESLAGDGESLIIEVLQSKRDIFPRIRDLRDELGGLMAVIGTAQQIEELCTEMKSARYQFVKDLASDELALGDLPILLTPDRIKGLEFDTVVLVQPADILKRSNHPKQDIYVATSRATKRLVVLATKPLTLDLRNLLGIAT